MANGGRGEGGGWALEQYGRIKAGGSTAGSRQANVEHEARKMICSVKEGRMMKRFFRPAAIGTVVNCLGYPKMFVGILPNIWIMRRMRGWI